MVSCLEGNEAGCRGCGECECLSESGYWRDGGAKGEGRPPELGCGGMLLWCEYWLGRAPEMTSEMEGSDWRAGASVALSSGCRRGSDEEIMLGTGEGIDDCDG